MKNMRFKTDTSRSHTPGGVKQVEQVMKMKKKNLKKKMTPEMKKIASKNFKKKIDMKIKSHQRPSRSKIVTVGAKRPRGRN